MPDKYINKIQVWILAGYAPSVIIGIPATEFVLERVQGIITKKLENYLNQMIQKIGPNWTV